MEQGAPQALPEIQRDPDYYFPDGNIIIRVEETLFKVHRGILTRESSTFGAILAPIPLGAGKHAGGSDQNPLVLLDVSVDRFWALLWILYALPTEIADLSSDTRNADVDRLVEIASITHQYKFNQTEGWAHGVLLNIMKRQKYSKHQHLLSLLDYAVTSNKPSLRVVVQKLLMDQIIKGIVQYAPVIHFAERREGETWKSILGQAYYHYALKGPARWQSDPALTKGHKERLYVGYGKLVELRESSFVWKHVCGVEKDCVADLERRVIGPGFSGPFVDYLGWASWFDKRFRKQWNYKFRTCHRTPFTACSIKAGALKDNLHDCFATLA